MIALRSRIAGWAEGLQAIDFSDRVTPKIVGAYETGGPARDVAVSGDLVFVVVAEANARPQDGGRVVILRRQR